MSFDYTWRRCELRSCQSFHIRRGRCALNRWFDSLTPHAIFSATEWQIIPTGGTSSDQLNGEPNLWTLGPIWIPPPKTRISFLAGQGIEALRHGLHDLPCAALSGFRHVSEFRVEVVCALQEGSGLEDTLPNSEAYPLLSQKTGTKMEPW